VAIPPWVAEAAAAVAVMSMAGLAALAARYRGAWQGWAASVPLLLAALGSTVFLLSPLPMPAAVLAVRWPAFLAGLAAGGAAALLLRSSLAARAPKLGDPGLLWRGMTPHEVAFLRRIWRVGFILEEDDALRQEARPDRLHATLHDLEESKRLIFLNKVRGGSGNLRAYRLTAAGKDLMTWVTTAGR
jgi:hypothetical protein